MAVIISSCEVFCLYGASVWSTASWNLNLSKLTFPAKIIAGLAGDFADGRLLRQEGPSWQLVMLREQRLESFPITSYEHRYVTFSYIIVTSNNRTATCTRIQTDFHAVLVMIEQMSCMCCDFYPFHAVFTGRDFNTATFCCAMCLIHDHMTSYIGQRSYFVKLCHGRGVANAKLRNSPTKKEIK